MQEKARGISDTLDPTVRDFIRQDCVYIKTVFILESISGKIKLIAFIQTVATR